MKLSIISFTARGNQTGKKLTSYFLKEGENCRGYCLARFWSPDLENEEIYPLKTSLSEWTRDQFAGQEGIIFIGAVGIAVRAIAPHLKSKSTDPAVVVVDEEGSYSISLLSGHIGGANELARQVAGMIGAVPIITTATDIQNKFAVDVFAKQNGLHLTDGILAKEISADLLDQKSVGFISDFPIQGSLPQEIVPQGEWERGIWITVKNHSRDKHNARLLRLIPKVITLGIGCRKGTLGSDIEAFINKVLEQENIAVESIEAVASIDLKQKESGLVTYADKIGAKFLTYTARELEEVPGDFAESDFVKRITGVGNICQRAAVLSASDGRMPGKLISKKWAENGITAALAIRTWKGSI